MPQDSTPPADVPDVMKSAFPRRKPAPVCEPGEFVFAAACLDHGHINGQVRSLIQAGGVVKWVCEPDDAKAESFLSAHPECRRARCLEEILEDAEVRMVAAAAVPCERGPLGVRVLRAGKDYFTDKSPFTTRDQLEDARRAAAETGRKYMVYYGERLCSESGIYAGGLIEQGAIGRVFHVLGLGPHRLRASARPAWFFQKEKYGGILTDIGSHQCEQFLFYTGARDADVASARVANHDHGDYPGLEDFGEAHLVGDNGASFYFRVDWFTPDGLRNWGDGRTLILGTEGYIELRKYVDIGSDRKGNQVYLVNGDGEFHVDVSGRIGYPFFGQLILDSLNRTENAMSQDHAFKAADLSMKAQALADGVDNDRDNDRDEDGMRQRSRQRSGQRSPDPCLDPRPDLCRCV